MIKIKKSMGKRAERTLKSAMFYTLELFIDVLLVYFIVRGFSVALDFTYNVFSDSAASPGSNTTVTVEVGEDESAMDIAKTLYKAKLVKNKYVMAAKLYLRKYNKDIKPGKYKLKASMTYNEIIESMSGRTVIRKVVQDKNKLKRKNLDDKSGKEGLNGATSGDSEKKEDSDSSDSDSSDSDSSDSDSSDSDSSDSDGGSDDSGDGDYEE